MSTSGTAIITEADVFEWLRARAGTYGLAGLELGIHTKPSLRAQATVWEPQHFSGYGKTLDDAVAMLRTHFKTPAERAAAKRAEAARLLAEADALAPAAPVAPMPAVDADEVAEHDVYAMSEVHTK